MRPWLSTFPLLSPPKKNKVSLRPWRFLLIIELAVFSFFHINHAKQRKKTFTTLINVFSFFFYSECRGHSIGPLSF